MGPQVKSQGSSQVKGSREAEEREAGCYVAGLEKGGLGPRAKESRPPPEARKGQGRDFLLEPLEGIQPCHHLAFSSVRPMLEF